MPYKIEVLDYVGVYDTSEEMEIILLLMMVEFLKAIIQIILKKLILLNLIIERPFYYW